MITNAPIDDLPRRHRRVAMICASVVVAMVGMAYAAVPLYRLFCQVTGYGGTTQRAERPSNMILAQTVNVRFDSNVSRGLNWEFTPLQRTIDVRVGENTLVYYKARNLSDHPLTGTASFNVAPDGVGAYFNKLECFCFTEQTLQPGESIEMPVSFFVDPAMMDDKDARRIRQITLSYTFYGAEPRGNIAAGGSRKREGDGS